MEDTFYYNLRGALVSSAQMHGLAMKLADSGSDFLMLQLRDGTLKISGYINHTHMSLGLISLNFGIYSHAAPPKLFYSLIIIRYHIFIIFGFLLKEVSRLLQIHLLFLRAALRCLRRTGIRK